MFASEAVLPVGGIGYVVPAGGPEITGVLVLATGGSLLLQEASDTKQHRRITTLLSALCGPLRPSALTSFFIAEIAKDGRER
jgi:hypothetical protein